MGRKLTWRRFGLFAVVGGAGTVIQYITLGVGVSLFGVPAAISSAVGYLLGSVVNYLLNYRFTFKCKNAHSSAAVKYYIVLGVGWCINLLMMSVLVHVWHWNHWVAQVLTTAVGVVWNFIGSALWAFVHHESR